VTATQVYYVEAVSSAGCASATRKRVEVSPLAGLNTSVISVTSAAANSVTFSWTAVPGAISYEVSVNGGPFVSVGTSTTYTVTGLGVLSQATISVKAVASNPCLNTIAGPVSGCSNSNVVVTPTTQEICKGGNAKFDVSSPQAGITYNWYTTATGGSPIATATPTYTAPNVQATTDFYVSQSSGTCTSNTRTKVTVTVTPDLPAPVVKADTIRVNSIRFSWTAVPGATGYQVSFDGGTTWSTPSSGPTGLFHIRGGLLPSQDVTIQVRAIGACGNSVGTVTAKSLPEKIFVPNTFSPNGDGLNDRLLAYGYGVQTMQFMVFNQWGEKVFETSSQTAGWDGTYKGKPQPSGVYMYVLRATLTDGTKVDMKGSINLIR
jgi:gliding motility-associated-like protein